LLDWLDLVTIVEINYILWRGHNMRSKCLQDSVKQGINLQWNFKKLKMDFFYWSNGISRDLADVRLKSLIIVQTKTKNQGFACFPIERLARKEFALC